MAARNIAPGILGQPCNLAILRAAVKVIGGSGGVDARFFPGTGMTRVITHTIAVCEGRFRTIWNGILRSCCCPITRKIARLPRDSWRHLAGGAMPCRTNHSQDCKTARLPRDSWRHLAGGAMPCRTNHAQDGSKTPWAILQSCNLAGGWSCRAWHHPQDARKTPWAILRSSNLAGGGNIVGGAHNLCTIYIHPALCGHIHSMCLGCIYGGLMDGVDIACRRFPRPAILQDCKVPRGVLGQYCGLPLRYLGNIVGGAHNMCTIYIHPALCGHIHSMCIRCIYGGLVDGVHIACGMCPRPAILQDCKVAR